VRRYTSIIARLEPMIPGSAASAESLKDRGVLDSGIMAIMVAMFIHPFHLSRASSALVR
jgi:hypothetical protein